MSRGTTPQEEHAFWSAIEVAWAPAGNEVNAAREALATRDPKDDEDDAPEVRLVDEALQDMVTRLRAHLATLDREELVAFDRVLERKLYEIDREEIHDVTDGSDDGFLYARGFIVALGKRFYDAVNANPALALRDAECQEFGYVSADVHNERFGSYPETGSDICRETCSNKAGWPDSESSGARDNATVYAPLQMLPDERHLAPLAPGAAIEVLRDEGRVVLAWPDLRVALTRMDDAAMGAHLMGLQGYVRSSGGGEALAIRVLSTRSVYGFVIEPGFDDEGRAMHLVAGICGATGGLLFREGQILDGDGAPLLGPEARPLARPSPARVASRALVLLAVAMRGLLDDDAGTPDEAEADALRQRLVGWLEAHAELAREIEPHEAHLLRAPIGTAPRQAIVNAVWGAEGAAVLLWALRARDLPPHDVSEHPYEVAKASGVLADERPQALDATEMRSEEELWHEQRRLLAVHWRMMEARLHDRAVDFPALAQKEFLRGADLAGIPVAERDLAVDGLPVTKADAASLGRTASIALERHRAANWLVGVHPVYSLVPTPT